MEYIDPNKKYNIPSIAKAGWLGIDYTGIYNLINKGKLKAYNMGPGKIKRYWVLGLDIIEFLKKSAI